MLRVFFGLAQQQLRRKLKLKAVRRLCRSVLLGASCTLATSLGYSKIGGLQQLPRIFTLRKVFCGTVGVSRRQYLDTC